MNIYLVTYFDSIRWAYKTVRMLANSEEQIRMAVDHVCKKQFRMSTYGFGQNRVTRDSLEIKLEESDVLSYGTYVLSESESI